MCGGVEAREGNSLIDSSREGVLITENDADMCRVVRRGGNSCDNSRMKRRGLRVICGCYHESFDEGVGLCGGLCGLDVLV